MMGLCGCARPLISVLLKEQWLPCVPLMQILCFGKMTNIITIINLNLLYVKGRSDLVLKLEIFKKTIAFSILFISMFFGLKGMCCGQVLYAYLALYLNTHYTKKILGYYFLRQMKAMAPYLFLSLIVLVMAFLSTILIKNDFGSIFVSLAGCPIIYIVMARSMNLYAYQESLSLVREKCLHN